jgi:hypothetical protein
VAIKYGFPSSRDIPVKFRKRRPIDKIGANCGQRNIGTARERFHQQLGTNRPIRHPFGSDFNKPTLSAGIAEWTFQSALCGFIPIL